jgi:hypothetical protein
MNEGSTGRTSVAHVPTASARRYLSQLVKHFAHRLPTRLGETEGQIAFDIGRCELEARPDALVMTASAADPRALKRVEDLIARHLQRFAFREPLQVGWTS